MWTWLPWVRRRQQRAAALALAAAREAAEHRQATLRILKQAHHAHRVMDRADARSRNARR